MKIVRVDFDLVEIISKYENSMNYVSSFIFDNWRIISTRKLQPMVYAHLRENIGLKPQASCNIPRQVGETYKTIVEFAKIGMIYWQKVTCFPTQKTSR